MNPLPRFLAMALFVLLAALVALLAAPAWNELRKSARPLPSGVSSITSESAARLTGLSWRVALTLATASAGLALMLAIAASRSRAPETRPPFTQLRQEFGAIAKLAETSVAQGAALDRERDDRRRAEQDAQFQQQLLSQSVQDKIRLGHDLHDGIIQSLYAVGLTLESVRSLAKTDPVEADRRLSQCLDSLNGTIRDVRAYITGLAPENLRKAGFAQALDALVEELRAGRNVQFDLRLDDDATPLLSPGQSADALQIVREAISNSLRHGRASEVKVRLHRSDREVCLLVQDNGVGFDAHRRSSGHGLGNIQARAERVGASARVESQPGGGTRVIVTLPVLQPS